MVDMVLAVNRGLIICLCTLFALSTTVEAMGSEVPAREELYNGPLVVEYRVSEWYAPVSAEIKKMILASHKATAKDHFTWQEGNYETRRALVICDAGLRFERALLSANGVANADLQDPTTYPLQEVYVQLSSGLSEVARSGKTPDATGVSGLISVVPQPLPPDVRLDIFLGRRGYRMEEPFSETDTVEVRQREDELREISYTDSRGRRSVWVTDPAKNNLVMAYRFWDVGWDKDAPPLHEAICRKSSQMDGIWFPKEIEWETRGGFAGSGEVDQRARMVIGKTTRGARANKSKDEIRMRWPKGSFVRIEEGKAEDPEVRLVQVKEEGEVLDVKVSPAAGL